MSGRGGLGVSAVTSGVGRTGSGPGQRARRAPDGVTVRAGPRLTVTNRADQKRRQQVLELVRENYAGEGHERFGPTLASEHLAADHGLEVPRETLRRWMLQGVEAGVPEMNPDSRRGHPWICHKNLLVHRAALQIVGKSISLVI